MSATHPVPSRIVIATRESRLALWQARHVEARLRALHPGVAVELLGVSTQGDRKQRQPLSRIGGKGLFIKELETALREQRADLAVHSLKDVPMDLPAGFTLAAITARENPCDAFVSNRFADLDALPPGAVVGTSSLRRAASLRAACPWLTIETLRGNLDTRLRKLDEGGYDAIVLAAAGLIRLGLKERIRALLPLERFPPAPGQGALGVEILAARADAAAWLSALHDMPTACCVRAERAFSRALGGSCRIPLGGHATLDGGTLRLRGFVASPDGGRLIAGERCGEASEPEVLGRHLAEDLRARGAEALLAGLAGR
ncbi:MAG: hydroxymethylbilane synthase [Candidatus Accumulibacter sp.]|nr:hydroxymethylbilane synthase [Accumulibacter sp.]